MNDILKNNVFTRRQKINHQENIGKVFNRLTVIDVIKYSRYYKYICTCKCGKKTEAYARSVISGATTSCGCFYKESRKHKRKKARSDIKKGKNSSAVNIVYAYYKRNALSRGREFSIDKDIFYKLIKSNCHYCGMPPCQTKKLKNKKSPELTYNGIDRVDNELGYIESNSVPCCFICNRAKGSLSEQDFRAWLNNLIENTNENIK